MERALSDVATIVCFTPDGTLMAVQGHLKFHFFAMLRDMLMWSSTSFGN